jgi:hypothetical protein
MNREIEYSEVVICFDGEEYTVSFITTESWNYRDEGYADFSDYRWSLDSIEVTDIVFHEYLNEHGMCLNHPIDSLKKDFADKLQSHILKYAQDRCKIPDRDPKYYWDLDNIYDISDLYPSYDPGYYPYD